MSWDMANTQAYEAVKDIVLAEQAKGHSLRSIADILNDAHYPTPAGGAKWWPQSVSDAIKWAERNLASDRDIHLIIRGVNPTKTVKLMKALRAVIDMYDGHTVMDADMEEN